MPMKVVCKQWIDGFDVSGFHIDDVLLLIKEAYAERAKEGISFATLSYSVEDLNSERTDADYWFLAFDENEDLCGTARLTIKDNFGEICNFAVSPQKQGKHVGSLLLQAANRFAKEQELEYVLSYTAMKAASSVKCHCNNGFRIVGICFNLEKDYSSFVFRNQLSSSIFWNSKVLLRLRFVFFYTMYRLIKTADGKNTIVGRLLLFFKQKL